MHASWQRWLRQRGTNVGQQSRIFREENKLGSIYDVVQRIHANYIGTVDELITVRLATQAVNLALKDWEPARSEIERLLHRMLIEAADLGAHLLDAQPTKE